MNLNLSGEGRFFEDLCCNGKTVEGSYKILWNSLPSGPVIIEGRRTHQPPLHPVILRADGLSVGVEACDPGRLLATISGTMAGELLLWVPDGYLTVMNGFEVNSHDSCTPNTWRISLAARSKVRIEVIR